VAVLSILELSQDMALTSTNIFVWYCLLAKIVSEFWHVSELLHPLFRGGHR
jgi:hypothetical protein